MMSNSKYMLIVQKNIDTNQRFEQFKLDSKTIIEKIMANLVSYLECPDDRITWVRFSDEAVEVFKYQSDFLQMSIDNKTAIFLGSRIRFALHFLMADPKFEPDKIEFRFNISEVRNGYSLSHDDRKFTIDKDLEIKSEITEYIYQSLDKFAGNHYSFKKQSESFGFIPKESDSK